MFVQMESGNRQPISEQFFPSSGDLKALAQGLGCSGGSGALRPHCLGLPGSATQQLCHFGWVLNFSVPLFPEDNKNTHLTGLWGG